MRDRPITSEDIGAVVALINAAARGGEAELEPVSRVVFVETIGAPGIDPARDLRVWCGDGGGIVGFARIRIEVVGREQHARLYVSIAEVDDDDLEAAMVGWAARRLVEAVPDGAVVRLVHGVGVRDPGRAARLTALGFVPYRIKLSMARSNDDPPADRLPAGFALRLCRGADEAEAYAAAHNDAFADAHDFSPLTVEEMLHDLGREDYRADLDLVADTDDGEIAGYCYASLDAATPALGYIAALGVRRAYRQRGLAAGLLAEALRRLRAVGVTEAHLHVDDDSLTGAPRLYRRLGFAVRFAETRLSLDDAAVRAAAATLR